MGKDQPQHEQHNRIIWRPCAVCLKPTLTDYCSNGCAAAAVSLRFIEEGYIPTTDEALTDISDLVGKD